MISSPPYCILLLQINEISNISQKHLWGFSFASEWWTPHQQQQRRDLQQPARNQIRALNCGRSELWRDHDLQRDVVRQLFNFDPSYRPHLTPCKPCSTVLWLTQHSSYGSLLIPSCAGGNRLTPLAASRQLPAQPLARSVNLMFTFFDLVK